GRPPALHADGGGGTAGAAAGDGDGERCPAGRAGGDECDRTWGGHIGRIGRSPSRGALVAAVRPSAGSTPTYFCGKPFATATGCGTVVVWVDKRPPGRSRQVEVPTERKGGGDHGPHRVRHEQPADRRRLLHQREDGQEPHQPHL